MATGNYLLGKGYNAGSALSKFRAVVYSADEEVSAVSAVDDVIAGFAQFDVTAAEILQGKGATVLVDGITEAEVGNTTAIVVGDEIELLVDGRVGKAGTTGSRIVGVCVGSPSGTSPAAGDRISLRINLDGAVQ